VKRNKRWESCFALDGQGSIPGSDTEGIFSLRHRVQTASGPHSTFYPTGTRGSFTGVKAAEV
jgi:hypothetical protein